MSQCVEANLKKPQVRVKRQLYYERVARIGQGRCNWQGSQDMGYNRFWVSEKSPGKLTMQGGF